MTVLFAVLLDGYLPDISIELSMSARPQRTFECDPETLERLCVAKGWSVARLAEVSGVNARTLRRIQNGQPAFISTISMIASAFGVSVDYLLLATTSGTAAPPAGKPARFKLKIRIHGRIDVAKHRSRLARLTQDIVDSLRADGIDITGYGSDVVTIGVAASAEWRLLVAFPAEVDEMPCWGLAAIKPAMLANFVDTDIVDGASFNFGELLRLEPGMSAPKQAIADAAELFRCPPDSIIDLTAPMGGSIPQ